MIKYRRVNNHERKCNSEEKTFFFLLGLRNKV